MRLVVGPSDEDRGFDGQIANPLRAAGVVGTDGCLGVERKGKNIEWQKNDDTTFRSFIFLPFDLFALIRIVLPWPPVTRERWRLNCRRLGQWTRPSQDAIIFD
jgi:hypothetical protein